MKILAGAIILVLLVLILRAGELYTQLARYQKYWDKVNQRPIKKEAVVYVAFGDSAAQGVGASSPDKGYVGLIANQISGLQSQPVSVVNLSKSGATIEDILKVQLPDYEKLKISNKQILTVDIGANDIVRTDFNDFETNMDKLMSRLPKQVIMADIPSFRGSRYSAHEAKIKEANKIIYRLADKYGIEVVGVYERTSNNHNLRSFGGDFFHPSNYGYKTNWFDAFSDKVAVRVDSL